VIIRHMGYESEHDGSITITPKYEGDRLAKWGEDDDHFGTTSSLTVSEDQMWKLECPYTGTTDGNFYIVNLKYRPERLAKWGPGAGETGTYDGERYRNQLWRIIEVNTGSEYGYKICNYKYSDHCLSKWGAGDHEVGSLFNGKDVWSITPQYSNPTITWKRIREIDNTRGQHPIQKTG